ncbi:MAG: TolC family protein [Bacteroidota bacterium]
MYKYVLSLLFSIITITLNAQTTPELDWATFRQQVLSNHPLAKQADLYRDMGEASLLRARGGFDPKTYANYTSKNFKETQYFSYTEAGVKLPTWFGLELKGAYNYNSGKYLNEESYLPKNGQASFGFNWTLGQGLLIDERRTELKQAQVGVRQFEAERNAARNELLRDAAKAYWSWVLADNQVRVYEEALRQAQIRFDGIRESVRQGDKPAIDTVESMAQVQTRRLDVYLAKLDQQNASLELRNYLWDNNNQPVSSDQITTTPALNTALIKPGARVVPDSFIQAAFAQHPDLQAYAAKLQSLQIERRLKLEKRKPVLDLSYYLLGKGWQFSQVNLGDGPKVLANDIKWGLQFSYPIPNRKARGDVQLADLKIAQTNYALQQKRLTIENKVRQYANELNSLTEQVLLYRDLVASYRSLLDGEMERFRFGESSVFLINSREQRWLDAQVKYLKLLSEYRKAEAGLMWAAGRL